MCRYSMQDITMETKRRGRNNNGYGSLEER